MFPRDTVTKVGYLPQNFKNIENPLINRDHSSIELAAIDDFDSDYFPSPGPLSPINPYEEHFYEEITDPYLEDIIKERASNLLTSMPKSQKSSCPPSDDERRTEGGIINTEGSNLNAVLNPTPGVDRRSMISGTSIMLNSLVEKVRLHEGEDRENLLVGREVGGVQEGAGELDIDPLPEESDNRLGQEKNSRESTKKRKPRTAKTQSTPLLGGLGSRLRPRDNTNKCVGKATAKSKPGLFSKSKSSGKGTAQQKKTSLKTKKRKRAEANANSKEEYGLPDDSSEGESDNNQQHLVPRINIIEKGELSSNDGHSDDGQDVAKDTDEDREIDLLMNEVLNASENESISTFSDCEMELGLRPPSPCVGREDHEDSVGPINQDLNMSTVLILIDKKLIELRRQMFQYMDSKFAQLSLTLSENITMSTQDECGKILDTVNKSVSDIIVQNNKNIELVLNKLETLGATRKSLDTTSVNPPSSFVQSYPVPIPRKLAEKGKLLSTICPDKRSVPYESKSSMLSKLKPATGKPNSDTTKIVSFNDKEQNINSQNIEQTPAHKQLTKNTTEIAPINITTEQLDSMICTIYLAKGNKKNTREMAKELIKDIQNSQYSQIYENLTNEQKKQIMKYAIDKLNFFSAKEKKNKK